MSLIKRPVLHGVRLLFGLSAVSMPAALLDLLKHRYLQMAYANNAPQREIRLCDYSRVCSSSHGVNEANRVVFIAFGNYIHAAAPPSEESFAPGSW